MTTGSTTDGSRLPRQVHRLVWEAHYGPRPEGFDVHHTCENVMCVNVEHLKLLSHEEHSRLHHDGETASERSRYAMHVRWHVRRGVLAKSCPHCSPA